jgi:prophage tail gpP-like protein
VTRSLERFPSDFELSVTDKFPLDDTSIDMKPGQSVVVKFGKDAVLTGYIDRYEAEISTEDNPVKISGRSACQDLVDCAAQISTYQINSTTPFNLAGLLCDQFGIQVSAKPTGAANQPTIAQFNVILTESTYDILERVCRWAALIMYDDPSGNLVLAQVGQEQGSGQIVEGVNVQKASCTFSMDQRFSLYKAVYQSVDSLSDVSVALGAAAGASNIIPGGTFLDETVPRYRPKVIVSEQGFMSLGVAKQRASWEAARRYGRSQAVRVVVDSWRDSAGRLWQPNSFAALYLPSLKINHLWVIGEVTFMLDLDRGTVAELTLMPQAAYTPEPNLLYAFDARVWQALHPDQPIPGPVPR